MDATSSETLHVAVVACRADDEATRTYFVAVVEALVRRLVEVDDSPLEVELDILRGLFGAAGRPPTRTALGLWAELFVIHSAVDPEWIADAWRRRDEDRYDFGGSGWRLEVKGHGGRAREHHLSHRQSWPPEGLRVFFASIPIESTQGGITVQTLTDSVVARLTHRPDLVLKVRTVVATTLGRDILVETPAYDLLVAREGIRFYEAARLPRLPRNLPDGVLDARIVVDFDEVDADAQYLEAVPLRSGS